MQYSNLVTETSARKSENREELVFHATSEENSILSTEALVDGHAVQVSFDSGATASIISNDVVKKYSLKTLTSDIKVKTADNSVSNVIGVTEEVTIEVHGHICKLSLLIMDHEDHDVLLGLNWFAATGAGLFPAEKILKFPGQKIHLGMEGKWVQDELSPTAMNPYDEVLISEIIDSFDFAEESYWEPMTAEEIRTLKIEPSAEVNKAQLEQFNNTIKSLKPLFAVTVADLKSCKIGKHTIRTKDVNPIFSPPYRKSQAERLILKNEVAEMLKHGIIEQSKSEWSSPCVLVGKKDGTKRFCVDYRKLNAVTNNEQWPIPRIQDILDRMGGSIWFTAWDLTSGYWQIEMEESSKDKTAFSTPDGHYQFKRMPFGLKNAPAEFSRIMHRILGHRDYVEIYLDDITIHSKTFEEHIEQIKIVAAELIKAGLKVKPSKCVWLAKEVATLGYVVSGGQVSMDPKKVEPLKKRVQPTNVKQVQQFLGICNYYRRFVKGIRAANQRADFLPSFETTGLHAAILRLHRCFRFCARRSVVAERRRQPRIRMRIRVQNPERSRVALRNHGKRVLGCDLCDQTVPNLSLWHSFSGNHRSLSSIVVDEHQRPNWTTCTLGNLLTSIRVRNRSSERYHSCKCGHLKPTCLSDYASYDGEGAGR